MSDAKPAAEKRTVVKEIQAAARGSGVESADGRAGAGAVVSFGSCGRAGSRRKGAAFVGAGV